MVAVQSTGCAPIVRAYERGERFAEPWEDAETIASGIRVPGAIGDFLILDAVRESGGFAIAVPDEAIEDAQVRIARIEGLLTSPEGAATFAGYEAALAQGLVSRDERVVLFNCGNGLKYPMPPVTASLDHTVPIDWAALAGE
jgi:threonine synthase